MSINLIKKILDIQINVKDLFVKFTLNHDSKKYKTLIMASKYHILKLYLMLPLNL